MLHEAAIGRVRSGRWALLRRLLPLAGRRAVGRALIGRSHERRIAGRHPGLDRAAGVIAIGHRAAGIVAVLDRAAGAVAGLQGRRGDAGLQRRRLEVLVLQDAPDGVQLLAGDVGAQSLVVLIGVLGRLLGGVQRDVLGELAGAGIEVVGDLSLGPRIVDVVQLGLGGGRLVAGLGLGLDDRIRIGRRRRRGCGFAQRKLLGNVRVEKQCAAPPTAISATLTAPFPQASPQV